jgi:aryl-alcohol dehydrogenase-like predicted oxidoreductase
VLYRSVGQTDLIVSEIAFGCGGNAGLMIRGTPAEQQAIIARALELGINYFDNAPSYGAGAAEEGLGIALKAIGARPIINTKVEIRRHDLNDVAGRIVRSAEESMRRLRVDVLDMFQIHNGPTGRQPIQEDDSYKYLSIDYFFRSSGVLEGIDRLKRAGKIRYAGFICRGNDATEVAQLLETGMFHLINAPMSLINPTTGRIKPEGLLVDTDYGNVAVVAEGYGASTAIFSPLASGFLTDDSVAGLNRPVLARSYDLETPRSLQLRDIANKLSFLARESGLTLAQAAYCFVLMHQGVATAIGGFSTRGQLEEIASVSGMPPFSSMQINRLEALWHSNFAISAY